MRTLLGLLVLAFAGLILFGFVRQSLPTPPDGLSADARQAVTDAALGDTIVTARTPFSRTAGRLPSFDAPTREMLRAELRREAQATYIDSLFATTDSLLRRWPDSSVRRLRVRLIEGGPADYAPRFAAFVREAQTTWENQLPGVRFVPAFDSTDTDITVRWIDHFEFDRAGQTDLTWDLAGRVRRATVTLGVRSQNGRRIPDDDLRAVVLHEFGHALGLPHSADSTDVMYPVTKTGNASERDRRSLALLYRLPMGSIKTPTTGAAR
jgi:predicted Zn-dependent protease